MSTTTVLSILLDTTKPSLVLRLESRVEATAGPAALGALGALGFAGAFRLAAAAPLGLAAVFGFASAFSAILLLRDHAENAGDVVPSNLQAGGVGDLAKHQVAS